jgi:hypothetical protein
MLFRKLSQTEEDGLHENASCGNYKRKLVSRRMGAFAKK